VDSIGAGVNTIQAKELVGRALYQLMWPTLNWPEGNTKRAREARQSAVICAERILERIGREQYQQALDACYVLLTKPSKAEDEWIAGAKTPYGLIDLVTRKVSDMRAEGTWLQRPVFGTEADPALTDTWQKVREIIISQISLVTYELWMERSELLSLTADACLVRLDGSGGEMGLRPVLERALSQVLERHIEVVFEGE
jgi:hypothetical protein